MNQNVVVIGICGPSASGKSLLSENLSKHLALPSFAVIHADDFLDATRCPPIEEVANYRNLELSSCIDWKSLIKRIHTVKSTLEKSNHPKILIVEGFVLFCEIQVLKLFTIKIFLEASKELCFVRRRDRKKERSASNLESYVCYFEKYIWPCHLQNKETFAHLLNKEIFVIKVDNTSPNEVCNLSQPKNFI